MTTLFLDLETYCAVPITHGTHAYAEQAEVLLVAYAFDDEVVQVLDLTDGGNLDALQLWIDTSDEVVIHNSAFDRTILLWQRVNVPLHKTFDTMALALLHGLPGSLGQLCDILGVAHDKAKDKAGKKLIHLFTKPLGKNRVLDRATSATHPAEWAD
ncbi:MAG: DNA polymerase, partial [Alphaproteobacteria bacterium]